MDGTATGQDQAAIEAVLAGDMDAFEEIMRRHNQRLFRAARAILGNDADAEDVVQDAYIKAFTSLAAFKGPSGFRTWLTRICVNQAISHRRRPQHICGIDHEPTGEDRMMSLTDDYTPDPERYASNVELTQMIEQAVDRLPEDFRIVFVLRLVDGLSSRETAEILDIPPATVKTRLHRARLLLQEHLNNHVESYAPTLFAFAGARCDRIVKRVLERLRH